MCGGTHIHVGFVFPTDQKIRLNNIRLKYMNEIIL